MHTQRAMSKKALVAVVVAFGVLLLMGGACVSTYNGLVAANQEVEAQWSQVENVYQRRLDLVPNLVETVKGAAAFEKETFTAVAEARTRAAQLSGAAAQNTVNDPAALEKYQGAQEQLSSALSRLMVVVERYPELKATQNFRDLQAQLEGTENRIAVERMRFNDVAKRYNTKVQSFPTNLVAGAFGDRFKPKSYFHASPAAAEAPKVTF